MLDKAEPEVEASPCTGEEPPSVEELRDDAIADVKLGDWSARPKPNQPPGKRLSGGAAPGVCGRPPRDSRRSESRALGAPPSIAS